MTEEQAFKMCTLNPATMLHIADRVGSIKVGKDADVVLWNANPLSVYATAQKTLVDGIEYYDRQTDSPCALILLLKETVLYKKCLLQKKPAPKHNLPFKPVMRLWRG